jgi:hypothetical protein
MMDIVPYESVMICKRYSLSVSIKNDSRYTEMQNSPISSSSNAMKRRRVIPKLDDLQGVQVSDSQMWAEPRPYKSESYSSISLYRSLPARSHELQKPHDTYVSKCTTASRYVHDVLIYRASRVSTIRSKTEKMDNLSVSSRSLSIWKQVVKRSSGNSYSISSHHRANRSSSSSRMVISSAISC